MDPNCVKLSVTKRKTSERQGEELECMKSRLQVWCSNFIATPLALEKKCVYCINELL